MDVFGSCSSLWERKVLGLRVRYVALVFRRLRTRQVCVVCVGSDRFSSVPPSSVVLSRHEDELAFHPETIENSGRESRATAPSMISLGRYVTARVRRHRRRRYRRSRHEVSQSNSSYKRKFVYIKEISNN